jgi:hypothetical protein
MHFGFLVSLKSEFSNRFESFSPELEIRYIAISLQARDGRIKQFPFDVLFVLSFHSSCILSERVSFNPTKSDAFNVLLDCEPHVICVFIFVDKRYIMLYLQESDGIRNVPSKLKVSRCENK